MKKRLISCLSALAIAFALFSAPVQTVLQAPAAVAEAASDVSAPKPNQKSGTYYSNGSISVALSSSTSGAKIYVSVNGAAYRRYTKAIKLTRNTVIKTYAAKNGVKSNVAVYKYYLVPKVTVSVDSGEYEGAQKVLLSSGASGVRYYYTTDGSKPTTSSDFYTSSGITISESCTLTILVVRTNWKSRIITKEYSISTPENTADSILDDYQNKWAYNTLSQAQKKGYAALFEGAAKHEAVIDLTGLGIKLKDLEKMYWAFDYDNPQFFWLGNGFSYSYKKDGTVLSVSIIYGRTAAEAAKLQPQFDKAADKIIAEALKCGSTAERVRVIHDALVNATTYSTTGSVSKSEADGPLVSGKALCEGYSKAFAYLCQSIGIPCVCVGGTSNGYGHMWNMVQVDGVWYHIDVTWDDPVSSTPILRYDYFLLSKKDMCADHIINTPFALPEAAKTYNS